MEEKRGTGHVGFDLSMLIVGWFFIIPSLRDSLKRMEERYGTCRFYIFLGWFFIIPSLKGQSQENGREVQDMLVIYFCVDSCWFFIIQV
jgi:hypothetical protein